MNEFKNAFACGQKRFVFRGYCQCFFFVILSILSPDVKKIDMTGIIRQYRTELRNIFILALIVLAVPFLPAFADLALTAYHGQFCTGDGDKALLPHISVALN